jgi:hypothetical protein
VAARAVGVWAICDPPHAVASVSTKPISVLLMRTSAIDDVHRACLVKTCAIALTTLPHPERDDVGARMLLAAHVVGGRSSRGIIANTGMTSRHDEAADRRPTKFVRNCADPSCQATRSRAWARSNGGVVVGFAALLVASAADVAGFAASLPPSVADVAALAAEVVALAASLPPSVADVAAFAAEVVALAASLPPSVAEVAAFAAEVVALAASLPPSVADVVTFAADVKGFATNLCNRPSGLAR